MKVLKFGGTSLGTLNRIRNVAKLISDGNQKILVLFAMSGETNHLIELTKQNITEQQQHILSLHQKYLGFLDELVREKVPKDWAKQIMAKWFARFLEINDQDQPSELRNNELLALGERLSTLMMAALLKSQKISCKLLFAEELLHLDENRLPNYERLAEQVKQKRIGNDGCEIYIVQGFICADHLGNIDNLDRGGSDYSASIFGKAIGADEIQIWTDIDGMHNCDPRFVENTKPIEYLNFEEAAELAYFGAKILHPLSILPAMVANIPVRLKNTMEPKKPGTLIGSEQRGRGVKSIAAKDGITAVKIKSARMLLAYGFIRRVFEVFETYKTPIDLISTSEVAVSTTIDDTKHLNEIIRGLKELGEVEVDKDLSIVCVVGNFIAENKGQAAIIFSSLKDIPLRMICYGGSKHNISILIQQKYKQEALKALHTALNK
jgi:aspartate kinase